jgi:hypothetical protein
VTSTEIILAVALYMMHYNFARIYREPSSDAKYGGEDIRSRVEEIALLAN